MKNDYEGSAKNDYEGSAKNDYFLLDFMNFSYKTGMNTKGIRKLYRLSGPFIAKGQPVRWRYNVNRPPGLLPPFVGSDQRSPAPANRKPNPAWPDCRFSFLLLKLKQVWLASEK